MDIRVCHEYSNATNFYADFLSFESNKLHTTVFKVNFQYTFQKECSAKSKLLENN